MSNSSWLQTMPEAADMAESGVCCCAGSRPALPRELQLACRACDRVAERGGEKSRKTAPFTQ